jgi:hypothetical protein
LIFPLLISSPSATHVATTQVSAALVVACTEAASTVKPAGIPIFARSASRSEVGRELLVNVTV